MSSQMSATSTVADAIRTLAQLDSTGLTVRSERCVRVRNRHASCSRCADACTSGAISTGADVGELVVDASLCVGCGTCATVCPTSALEPAHPNDNALLDQARRALSKTGGLVVAACYKALSKSDGAVEPDAVVGLTCLSRMEESVAATLMAEGARGFVLVRGDCSRCPREAGIASAELVRDTMLTLCDAWGVDCSYEIADEFPPGMISGETSRSSDDEWASQAERVDVPLAKRADARLGAQGGHAARFSHVQTDGTLPHFVPLRRERLLDALLQLEPNPQADAVECRLWGHVQLDASLCRSCTMCTVFCPTGALTLLEGDDGSRSIEHYASECVHCLLCQDICFGGAIECESKVPLGLLAQSGTEHHPIPSASWHTGPDQILQRMRPQISGNEVTLSYASER